MAMKGYLSDITFVELIRVVGKHNGKLGIWNFAERRQYECYFSDQKIVYLNIDGKTVTDQMSVKNFVTDLSRDRQSYYAFQKDELPISNGSVNVSVSDLLKLSVSDASENEDHLPNIQTKFETVNKTDINLEGEMEEFWKRCSSYLHKGSSIAEVCDAFGLEIKEIQQNFYKLRVIGLIKPVRAFSVSSTVGAKLNFNKNLRKIATVGNGEISELKQTITQSEPDNLQPIAAVPNLVQPVVNQSVSVVQPIVSQHPFVLADDSEIDSLLELQPKLELPTNNSFLDKFSEHSELPQPLDVVSKESSESLPFISDDTLAARIIAGTSVSSNSVASNNSSNQPVKKPIFDIESVERKGLIRRMLGSLFSKKSNI